MKTDYLRRYARHIVLPEIGEAGQRKLAASSVLVAGAGGLGAASIGYLSAMGVGRIGIVDHDRVELSNLQRQVLYETGDIGRPKVEAAADRVEEVNPDIAVETHPVRLDAQNASALVKPYDIVLDGTDNFATRFALHETCYHACKPLIYAAISGFDAQITTFKAHLGAPHPCLCCFIREAPERERSCAQEGIIGALAGVAGSMQALEAVKELLGIGESLSGTLILYEVLAGRFRRVVLTRDTECIVCGASSSSSLSA